MEPKKEQQIIEIPTDQKGSVEIVPFGSDERIRLSIAIVQKMIAVPTRAGKLPDDNQCMKFIMLCRSKHLNPFEGDAYLIGYDTQSGPQFSLITAHQVFLKRAEASKGFDGMASGVIVQTATGLEEHEGDLVTVGEKLIGGWAKVYRKDKTYPYYKRLSLAVFNTNQSRWAKDPAGMIVKCAEADALRTAFPTHLGGLYLQEESSPIDVTPVIQRAKVPKITNGKEGDAPYQINEEKSSVTTPSAPSTIQETKVASEAAPTVQAPGAANQRAKVPKQLENNLPVPVLSEPSLSPRDGEARESTTKRHSLEPSPALTEDSRGGQTSKKKPEPLRRKTRTLSTNEPVDPNRMELMKRLEVGGFNPQHLMDLARTNEWITDDEQWPLSEERCVGFLEPENWNLIMSELDAAK